MYRHLLRLVFCWFDPHLCCFCRVVSGGTFSQDRVRRGHGHHGHHGHHGTGGAGAGGAGGLVGSGVPKLFCNFICDFTLVKDKHVFLEIEIIETPILKDGSHFYMELH